MGYKPDYTDPSRFGEPDGHDEEPWGDMDNAGDRRDAELEDLQGQHPGRFISYSVVLAPNGHRVETTATHEPLIGDLIVRLTLISEPRNAAVLHAMEALRDALAAPGAG